MRLALRCLLAVAITAALACALLSAAGCGSGSHGPSEAEKTAACAENQVHIKQMMDLFYADAQEYPPIATVVDKLHVTCPDGGTYTFDEQTDAVSCSVHGHL
jgi:hypothetical protein